MGLLAILSDYFYVILLIIVIAYFVLQNNKTITYYVEPSNIDVNFQNEVIKILSTSKINDYYKIQPAGESSDITIRLVDRKKLHEDETSEYYPGTNKKIWFSYTWQHPKPHIGIDSGNWLYGVPESKLSLEEYRKYVIRHEFMHALGYDHQPCNATTSINGTCPVLYQATRGPPTGFNSGTDVIDADFKARIDNAYLKN